MTLVYHGIPLVSSKDMPATLTTYITTRRTTVRSAPDGMQLLRMEKGRELTGWEAAPGWVAWVHGGEVAGYVKVGHVRRLQERAA